MYQKAEPASEAPGRRPPRRSTPSAVMPAAYQSLTSVPRRKNCTREHAGQRHAQEAGRHPDHQLIAQHVPYQRRQRDERIAGDLKHHAHVRQLDVVPADDAGDRAHVVAHAPALVARVVADRRVRKPAAAGDRRKRRQQRDRAEVDVGKRPALRPAPRRCSRYCRRRECRRRRRRWNLSGLPSPSTSAQASGLPSPSVSIVGGSAPRRRPSGRRSSQSSPGSSTPLPLASSPRLHRHGAELDEAGDDLLPRRGGGKEQSPRTARSPARSTILNDITTLSVL